MSRALRIVFAGHVDHGKSTIIGRLLHETGNLPDGKLEELENVSRRRGVPMEWSFALDALQAERDQAVTIDTTRVWFSWKGTRYAIIDAPGHREFVRNMFSGAAEADAAILVVDAAEGVSDQTRRHAQLLHLLGLNQVAIAVNKMDAVKYDRAVFERVGAECRDVLRSVGIAAVATIPLSAREGDNFTSRSERMPWYAGPLLIETIAAFTHDMPPEEAPLRMRVQDVYREDGTRIVVGRIDSGSVAIGDTIVISPEGTQATVRSIERWHAPVRERAGSGESIGLTLNEQVFAHRGDVIAHVKDAPALDYGFHATCFWLSETPPIVGERLQVQFGPTAARAIVAGVEAAVDSASLERVPVDAVAQYAMVELRLRSNALLPLDTSGDIPATARLVLMRGRDVVAGGFVSALLATARTSEIHPAQHLVTAQERVARNGHRGAVIWLTGLSGAGKSTLAMGLEKRLFVAGASVLALDGDAIRSGLNSDLGFSVADRAENIRRIGEVAALLASTGTIVIAAFISPMQRDRDLARRAAKDAFHEVYVRAGLATCESRDVKGLYKRARAGEIGEFTGISSPYEEPETPELIVDTETHGVDECVEKLAGYVSRVTGLS